MEDSSLTTIIYIVIFVLIAIFNIYASNKKKALEKEKKLRQLREQSGGVSSEQNPMRPTADTNKPKSLEDFIKNVFAQEENSEKRIEPSYDNLETIEESQNQSLVIDEDKNFRDFVIASKKPTTRKPSLIPIITNDDCEFFDNSHVLQNIREGDFDIREAILYSEIVNRKF